MPTVKGTSPVSGLGSGFTVLFFSFSNFAFKKIFNQFKEQPAEETKEQPAEETKDQPEEQPDENPQDDVQQEKEKQ